VMVVEALGIIEGGFIVMATQSRCLKEKIQNIGPC